MSAAPHHPTTVRRWPIGPLRTLEKPPLRRLGADAIWSLVSNIVYALCQLGIVIVIAKLGNESMVGRYALAFAITTPIILFANCALRTVQATDATNEFAFGNYLAFRVAALGTAAMLIVVVSVVWGGSQMQITLAIGAAKIFESLGDLIHGFMQRYERLDMVGKSVILRGLSTLAAVTIALYATGDILIACWVIAITSVLVLLTYDIPAGRKLADCAGEATTTTWFWPQWTRSQLAALARQTLPMGVTVTTGALIASMPRFMLERLASPEQLGIFAALAWISSIGNLLAAALAQAALPRLSQHYAERNAVQFETYFFRLLIVGLVAGFIAVAAGSVCSTSLLRIIYGPEYALHADAFIVLLFATTFAVAVCWFDHALYAAREFRAQVPLNVITIIAMAVASALLIPAYGVLGAAWATCSAMILQAMLRLKIVVRILNCVKRDAAAAGTTTDPLQRNTCDVG